jgi:hypothetical protein
MARWNLFQNPDPGIDSLVYRLPGLDSLEFINAVSKGASILENITKEQTTYSIYAVLYSSAQVEQNETKTQNIFFNLLAA